MELDILGGVRADNWALDPEYDPDVPCLKLQSQQGLNYIEGYFTNTTAVNLTWFFLPHNFSPGRYTEIRTEARVDQCLFTAEHCHEATNVNRRALDCPNEDTDVVRVRQPTWERGAMADSHYVICCIPGKGLRQSLPYVHLPTHWLISERKNRKKGKDRRKKTRTKHKCTNTSINKENKTWEKGRQ
jgi:hypothetical protein